MADSLVRSRPLYPPLSLSLGSSSHNDQFAGRVPEGALSGLSGARERQIGRQRSRGGEREGRERERGRKGERGATSLLVESLKV